MKLKPPFRTNREAEIIDISKQGSLLVRKADERVSSGDYIGALKLFRRALGSMEPDSKEYREVQLMVTDCFLEMGCPVDALGALSPLLKPEIAEARSAALRLGHCLACRGELKAAVRAFHLAMSDHFKADPLMYYDFNNAMDSADLCEQTLADEQDSAPLLRDVDEIEIERIVNEAAEKSRDAEFSEAIAILEEARGRYPDSEKLFTDLLLDYYCDQRFDAAYALYESAGESFKDDITVECCALMLFDHFGMREREEEILNKMLAREPGGVPETVRAYTVLVETGHYSDALLYAETLVDQEPYNRTYRHFLAHAAFRTGDIELAKSCYEFNLAIEPHDSAAVYYLGVCRRALEEGAEPTPIQIDYSIPHAEFIRRCTYLKDLIDTYSGDLTGMWREHREEMLVFTDWALTDTHCPFGDLFLLMLSRTDPGLAEALMRRLLVEPNCSPQLRRLALVHLKDVLRGDRKEHDAYILTDGELEIVRLAEQMTAADFPASYQEIFKKINEYFDGAGPDELRPVCLGLCYIYALANYQERPRLPYGQSDAMAAAIIFFVLSLNEEYAFDDLPAFAAERGLTVRRIENAAARLMEVPDVNRLLSEFENYRQEHSKDDGNDE
ncbi:MAG: hypothetical protein IJM85_06665 [Clostridia bacterium]|nr:hypothetical protein [Clostridia bacterium]